MTSLRTSFNKRTKLSKVTRNKIFARLFIRKRMRRSCKEYGFKQNAWNRWLTSRILKFFWKDISTLLVSALNYAFESGCLSITQRRGVIKLTPKKDAELYYIENWRPITLLNTDYKIAAKALANRIKSVLPSIIHTYIHTLFTFLIEAFQRE